MDELQTCFVIAPIGEPNSEIRIRSDKVLRHIIAPAAEECGYKTLRADQIAEPGIITTQVIQHIMDDPLVIADLTGPNANVFYELAVRHAIKKPLVQIIEKGQQIPFDLAATRTIVVNHQDLDSADEAKNQIASQIRAVSKDPTKVDSPISMSIDLQKLRQSDTPEKRTLADIIEGISETNLGIKKIQNVLQDEAVLLDKRNFRDVSLAMERIRIQAHEAGKKLDIVREWIFPSDLDEKEAKRRDRDFREISWALAGIEEGWYELNKLLKL